MKVDSFTYSKFNAFEKVFFQKLNDLPYVPLLTHKSKLKKLIAVSAEKVLNNTKSTDLNNELFTYLIKENEAEKNYYGRELHDGLEQVLSSLNFYIDALVHQNKDNRFNSKHFKALKKLGIEALSLSKEMANDLMFNKISESGLISAIQNLITNISFNCPLKINFKTDVNFSESKLSITKKHQIYNSLKVVLRQVLKNNLKENINIRMAIKYGTLVKIVITQKSVNISQPKFDEYSLEGYNNLKHRLSILESQLYQKRAKDLNLVVKTPIISQLV
jgi:signal transduction histidine kinase